MMLCYWDAAFLHLQIPHQPQLLQRVKEQPMYSSQPAQAAGQDHHVIASQVLTLFHLIDAVLKKLSSICQSVFQNQLQSQNLHQLQRSPTGELFASSQVCSHYKKNSLHSALAACPKVNTSALSLVNPKKDAPNLHKDLLSRFFSLSFVGRYCLNILLRQRV